MRIKIERLTPDRLERQLWDFNLDMSYSNRLKITLFGYVEQVRKTTRHNFKDVRIYDAGRVNDIIQIKKDAVPLPDDVINDVKCYFRAGIDNAEIL